MKMSGHEKYRFQLQSRSTKGVADRQNGWRAGTEFSLDWIGLRFRCTRVGRGSRQRRKNRLTGFQPEVRDLRPGSPFAPAVVGGCRNLLPLLGVLRKKKKKKQNNKTASFPPLREPPFSYLATTSSSSNYLCSLSSLSRKSLQNKKKKKVELVCGRLLACICGSNVTQKH